MTYADTVLLNGRIFCGLAEGFVEALAIGDGKVLAAGSATEIAARYPTSDLGSPAVALVQHDQPVAPGGECRTQFVGNDHPVVSENSCSLPAC